jgi:hypothetical protein
MAPSDPTPFLKVAAAAFPRSCRTLVEAAGGALAPFVHSDRHRPVGAVVLGEGVLIPYRIYLPGLVEGTLQAPDNSWPAIQCLCTRSNDGHMRQTSLKAVLRIGEPWAVPFIVLPAGEYVVEITEDLVAALPTLDRGTYVDFVRENRRLMRRLRSKAISYWNHYYRRTYPDRSSYPGLVFLHQLELWAS